VISTPYWHAAEVAYLCHSRTRWRLGARCVGCCAMERAGTQ
jgi:hypothetical protein